jgi:hypothetical protein
MQSWADKTFTVGWRAYTGGTLKGQAAILLHELGHLMSAAGGAAGFQYDAGKRKAGRSNDNLVDQNCGKLIGGSNESNLKQEGGRSTDRCSAPRDRATSRVRSGWGGEPIEYRMSGAPGDAGLSAVASHGRNPGHIDRQGASLRTGDRANRREQFSGQNHMGGEGL